jgi:hypothetical protein
MAALAGATLVRTAWGPVNCKKLYGAMGFPPFAAARLGMAWRGYTARPGTEDNARD